MSEVGSMEAGKSADKWDALRKAAEAATGGFTQTRWVFDAYAQRVTHWTGTIADCRYRRGHLDGPFIAEANPAAILELLNELATLSVTEGVDGWIDCKQKLPPENEDVLFNAVRQGIEVGWHIGKKWMTYRTDNYGDDVIFQEDQVTHWMPLPTAPQSSLDATKGESE